MDSSGGVVHYVGYYDMRDPDVEGDATRPPPTTAVPITGGWVW